MAEWRASPPPAQKHQQFPPLEMCAWLFLAQLSCWQPKSTGACHHCTHIQSMLAPPILHWYLRTLTLTYRPTANLVQLGPPPFRLIAVPSVHATGAQHYLGKLDWAQCLDIHKHLSSQWYSSLAKPSPLYNTRVVKGLVSRKTRGGWTRVILCRPSYVLRRHFCQHQGIFALAEGSRALCSEVVRHDSV